MDHIIRNYTVRVNSDLLEKFHYIARANGRSSNMQILMFIRKTVSQYESTHGVIQLAGQKFSASKKLPETKQK